MHITMTGHPCSGKTSISDILREKYNFKLIKMGDIFKAEAARRGISAAEFSNERLKDPSFDFKIDKSIIPTAKELENEDVVFDSRVAFHFLPKSFKVYIVLDEDEMVRRLLNSDRTGKEKYTDEKAARKALLDRKNVDRDVYKKIYNFDLEDFSNYDLILDTTNITPMQAADEIYKKCVEYYKKRRV